MLRIIGLKVVAIKSFNSNRRRKKGFTPEYILFDDGKTYIELEEQDYHDYHDCSSMAREIQVFQDAGNWQRMMDNDAGNHYPDADKGDFI